jgi:hypothetical protein
MLFIEKHKLTIEGFGSFNIKNDLLALGCVWAPSVKRWVVNKEKIQQIQCLLDQVNCDASDNVKNCWSRALQHHQLKFVSKTDSEYKNVYATFLLYLKE